MIRIVDRFLDHITMYRLVLYYLAVLLVAAIVAAFFGLVPHGPAVVAFSLAVVTAVSWATNTIFARVFAAPPNVESVYITAFILALILEPAAPSDAAGVGALIFASVWATASKYMVAVGRKHLFNPAAFGALLPALLLDHPATWWAAGSLVLLPITVAGGLTIARKLRRFDLIVAFLLAVLATELATAPVSAWTMAVRETLLSSPLFFFAFVMLTEPLTAPAGRTMRVAFAVIVGFLFAPNIHFGSFYLTPEIALLVGNLFAWAVSPKVRIMLTLDRIEQSAAEAFDFVFTPDRKLAFQAGQYLDWTLGFSHPDSRGNRRQFTIASAPTEDDIRLGVKFYPRASTFKRALGAMQPGDRIFASQLAGSFTLPADPRRKLAFIAGGIGITPFRSMLQYLVDRGEARPIVVVYGNERMRDIAYRDVLDAARERLGIPTHYAVAKETAPKGVYPGIIDARFIRYAVPDFRDRVFYVSGPQTMVAAVRRTLRRMGVRRSRIKVDLFTGFA
jgi:ferredoxin-NADP reductase